MLKKPPPVHYISYPMEEKSKAVSPRSPTGRQKRSSDNMITEGALSPIWLKRGKKEESLQGLLNSLMSSRTKGD